MLVASILMLLSVVVPHHHHSDGLPCYHSIAAEAVHGDSTEVPSERPDAHDCGCNGHNIALHTSVLSHVTDGDVSQYLFPLLIVFDYINPPQPELTGLRFGSEQAVYIESLHDTWISSASGLRAPPSSSL